MKVKSESEVAQSCPTLSDPMDCSLPGSSIHGIFQARVLEWDAIAFSILHPKHAHIHTHPFSLFPGLYNWGLPPSCSEPCLSPEPQSVFLPLSVTPPSCSSLRATSVFLQESFSSPERPISQPDAPLASVESLPVNPTPFHPNVSKMWPTFIFPSSSLLIPQTTAICLLPPPSAKRNLPRPWMTSRLPTGYLPLLTPTNPLLGLH